MRRATAFHGDDRTVSRAEYEALVSRVEALEAQRIRRDDRVVLIAIADAVQGRVFNAAELRAHALVNGELARALRPFTSAKRLGKFLRSIAGRSLGGLALQRIGRDRDGTLWAVQVVSDLHRGSGVLPREGA